MALSVFLVLLHKKEQWDQLVTQGLMDQKDLPVHEGQMVWLEPLDLQDNQETLDHKDLPDKLELGESQDILVFVENQDLVEPGELMDKMVDQVLQVHVEHQDLLV